MMGTAGLAAEVLLQMLNQDASFEAKVAAGTTTDSDVDAALAQIGVGSRQELVAAIAAKRARG
jgi:hypothetical protein